MAGLTAILCAIETEIKPFMAALVTTATSTNAMLTVHEGFIDDTPVAVACCGVCKVNAALAAQMLIDRYDVKQIIMSGTSGGIDPRLKVGDTVISTETAYHDVEDVVLTEQHPYLTELFIPADAELVKLCQKAVEQNPPPQPVYFGRIVTGESFVAKEGRDEIIERFNPLCVDMESAAVAHVCYVNAIPFVSVATVSDTEENVELGSFFRNAAMASERSFTVVRSLLKSLL